MFAIRELFKETILSIYNDAKLEIKEIVTEQWNSGVKSPENATISEWYSLSKPNKLTNL